MDIESIQWLEEFLIHQAKAVIVISHDRAFVSAYDSVKIHDRLSFDQFIQPMQILVFDKTKELITHLVNCNVGGLPLKWNRKGLFNHFPLRANGLYEPQHRVKLSFQDETIYNLN